MHKGAQCFKDHKFLFFFSSESIMSSSTDHKFAQQYEDNFDPKMYLEKSVFNHPLMENWIKPAMELQHRTFQLHEVKGDRVLDVGTGPSVYSSLVPAQHFREVYLSDYLTRNRQALTDWQDQSDKAYDVTPLMQTVARLHGNVKPPGFYEETLRQRIKGVLPIDVLLEDPFLGQAVASFDCITTSACLESACSTLEDFEKAVKNLMKYLKPKGYFFHITFIENVDYCIGGARFDTLCLTSDQIKEAYINGGLDPLFYEEISFGDGVMESVPAIAAGLAIGLWAKKSNVF